MPKEVPPMTAHPDNPTPSPKQSRGRWLWLKLYLPVWVFCAAWYWLGMGGGGWIMGYGILAMLVLLPLATLAASVAIGWWKEAGSRRWGALILLPALYGLHILVTTSLSTALGITNIAPVGVAVLVYPFAAVLLGLLVGAGARALREKSRAGRTAGK